MTDDEYKKWIRDAQTRRVISWDTVDEFYPRFFACVVGIVAGLVMTAIGGWGIGLLAGIIAYIIVRGAITPYDTPDY